LRLLSYNLFSSTTESSQLTMVLITERGRRQNGPGIERDQVWTKHKNLVLVAKPES